MIHYAAVAAYAILDPDSFFADQGDAGPERLVPIVLLALLMATSFDRTATITIFILVAFLIRITSFLVTRFQRLKELA